MSEVAKGRTNLEREVSRELKQELKRQKSTIQKLTEHENMMLGITTGVIEQVSTQPMMYWKNSFQQGLPFTLNPRLLYRGTFVSACNMAGVTGLQFLSSGFLQKLVAGEAEMGMTWGQEVSCAFLGGAMSGPVCCTMELAMIQQQNYGGSLVSTFRRIIATKGIMGLSRGLTCSTFRESFYTAGYLGIVPATQALVHEHTGNAQVGTCVGAIGGGLVCAAFSQPLDTAKTCMQGDIEKKKYGSTLQTMRTLHSELGIRNVFRGYWWRAAYIVLDFFILDWIARSIAPIMYPNKVYI